ncbi:MAG TPA: alpha/beta fold hydrolase [Candidatus Aphodousia gallistercoris]|nr:alpha/beta fold hydrolase [Candidatus Aphodousia gallistercoris]
MSFLSEFIEGILFKNDHRNYWRPQHFGMIGEPFKVKNSSDLSIEGVLLKPIDVEVKGTVLFFESAHYNLQFHLPQVSCLCRKGYRVIMFDYSGFGGSEGKPSFNGLANDAECVFKWVATRFKQDKLIFFAQGIGCDVALQLYKRHEDKVAGLILESAYASRKGWIKDRWGPVIGDFAASCLKCSAPEPSAILPFVKVPVLMVFPGRDNYIHSAQRKALLKILPKSAEILKVPEAKFLSVFVGKPNRWHDALLNFISKKCASGKKNRPNGVGK